MNASPRRWRLAAAMAGCALLVACGSQVPPNKFVGAQGGGDGNGSGTGGASGTATGAAAGAAGGGTVIGGGTTGGGTTGGGRTGGGTTGGGTTGGGTTGGGTTGGGSGRGSGGGSAGKATGGGGSSGGGAVSGIKAGSCAGFKNGTGVSNSTITLANASDLSGPVPGLFTSADQAMKAFVAYFNSTSSICGRKLSLESLDTQTSDTGDQQAATTACGNAFAMVGSMGAFDSGGAATVTNCGIPDLRSQTTTTQRYSSPDVFGAASLAPTYQPASVPDFFKKKFGSDVIQHAAFVYINAGASSINAKAEIAGWEHEGFKFIDQIGMGETDNTFTTIAAKLKGDGVKYVQYVGPYQYAAKLKEAIAGQDFNPVYLLDPTSYIPAYVQQGQTDNTYVFINSELFENAGSIPQMQLYLKWLNQVAPGTAPTYFGLYSWSAGLLFTQLATELGGKLTRSSLIAALKKVSNWTGGGMHAKSNVGAKITQGCDAIIELQGGKWKRVSSGEYTCGPVVKV